MKFAGRKGTTFEQLEAWSLTREFIMVHETRSRARSSAEEEAKGGTRKQKEDQKEQESDQASSKSKKAKVTDAEKGNADEKSAAQVAAEFDEFCKVTREHLSMDEMKRILETNGQDPSGSDDAVVPRCQDLLFFGPLERCPACNGQLEYAGVRYECRGVYNEWSTCAYHSRDPPRSNEPIKLPDGVGGVVADLIGKRRPRLYPVRALAPEAKPFAGIVIALSGRLSRTHESWKEEIEKHGGKLSKSVTGVTCLVVSPAERERGGSSAIVEAIERNVPVVSEDWLIDGIAKQAAQPLDAYDVVADLVPEGRNIPWDERDPGEAYNSLTAEVKLLGKRGVYKDSRLHQDGHVFERDGIIYNCAFALCDLGRSSNEYCIIQLIAVPENQMRLYYKRGRLGDDLGAEERNEEWPSVEDAIKEFGRLFEEITGNEFEPWEREKKFEKKFFKFFPIDMDDGIDVRQGGLGPHQLGVAVAHCKLDPLVANLMKVLCSQEIYRYALIEMGHDSLDLPMGMLTDFHLKRCEQVLLEFRDGLKSCPEIDPKCHALLVDFSCKWFTMMPCTSPFTVKNYQQLADHVASPLESVRDINVASRLIGDRTGGTVDDPLFDRYKKLGCSMTPLGKESDDYKMILKYLEKTYEPLKLGDVVYGLSVENIFELEISACPSLDDIKTLPNKVLLWCGTRTSNLLRHLHKGFLPAICAIPVPGYMFGRAIVCSDASAEAARYGFTAVDRPEGFLVLAVASLGEHVTEISGAPEDPKSLEQEKLGVKGLGQKTTDESEHFMWKDDIKVPCGRLIPSGHKGSLLEYNEYAVYDSKQVAIRFLVAVRYEEQNMEVDAAE